MKNLDIHYAILGDGRLARHIRHYLQQLGLKHSGWSRRHSSAFNTSDHPDAATRLAHCIAPATHVLLLVSDGAIGHILRCHPELQGRQLVHCAGAISLPGVAGAHPLMTFAERLYPIEEMRQIPFLVDEGYRFEDILPGLPNPHYSIRLKDKALYHALCVVAGNFPQILWQAVRQRLSGDLGLPPEMVGPYLRRSLENHLAEPGSALTGPLARDDQGTRERNRSALEGDALQALYQAFETFHAREKTRDARAHQETLP